MFWKKKNKTPEKVEQNVESGIEITSFRTSKPILPAKPGIKIDNMKKTKDIITHKKTNRMLRAKITNTFLKMSIKYKEESTDSVVCLRNDFYSRNYDINIIKAESILFEVYRETKNEDGQDLPVTFIGIRIFEDNELRENIILHSFEEYELFSYISCYRHKNDIDYAIQTANYIANRVSSGYELHDYKIKKKFVSEKHIYMLEIPREYEVKMPEPQVYFEKVLELEITELNRRREIEINSDFKGTK